MKIPHFRFAVLVAIACNTFLTPQLPAQQNTGTLRVDVLAGIDPANKKIHDQAQAASPTLLPKGSYIIAAVHVLGNEEKLIKAVDAPALARLIAQQLNLEGFTLAQPKTKPDFVLVADYGRGFPPNPHTDDNPWTTGKHKGLRNVDNLTDTKAIGSISFQKSYVGLDEKIQRADHEKLFIRITAWKYPENPNEKPKRLWRTTMNVDDPNHRDLNLVAAAMLTAGGPFFNQQTPNDTVAEIERPLPDGQVKVGDSVEVSKTPDKK